MIKIIKIDEPNLKSEICESVLRSLPDWFGIEAAIVDYIKDVRPMETWAAYERDQAIGFASINKHFPTSAEIHVMGILANYHRLGIGHQILKMIEGDIRKEGIEFLTVKTLSESRPNKEYDQTRRFYLKMGFKPIEEFKMLWGEGNPCLLLAKSL